MAIPEVLAVAVAVSEGMVDPAREGAGPVIDTLPHS
jgi:hypothetical protein